MDIDISIHALLTEGDLPAECFQAGHPDFNPRPPHGGRRLSMYMGRLPMDFNPRPPHGGRLIPKALEAGLSIFQSTPSSRRATPAEDLTRGKFDISIHALLTEGDGSSLMAVIRLSKFQSTPSSRRATRSGCRSTGFSHYFNPRPPHGGRPTGCGPNWRGSCISIHALLTEGDMKKLHCG